MPQKETFEWMRKEIPGMMLESVKMLQNNPAYVLEVQSTDRTDALRTYPRNPEDGRIDWARSNEDILRLINASSEPFEGAYCSFNEQRLVIRRASICNDHENYLAVAGQVSRIDSTTGYVEVIAGKGKLRLEKISWDGKVSRPADVISSTRQRLK